MFSCTTSRSYVCQSTNSHVKAPDNDSNPPLIVYDIDSWLEIIYGFDA
jgi:hypothetical protein